MTTKIRPVIHCCINCNGPFFKVSKRQPRFCGPGCRTANYRLRNRQTEHIARAKEGRHMRPQARIDDVSLWGDNAIRRKLMLQQQGDGPT